jgi:hypothetical protein
MLLGWRAALHQAEPAHLQTGHQQATISAWTEDPERIQLVWRHPCRLAAVQQLGDVCRTTLASRDPISPYQ